MSLSHAPAIGVDLGGTKCLALLVGPDGSVLAERRAPTPDGQDAILEQVATVAAELRVEAPDVAAVGLGAPGLVDRQGVMRFAPNLPDVVDVPFGEELGRRLGLPVVVENDVTCAAWGEHERGAAQGFDHVVLVTLGTGIGGGLISAGRLVLGAHGFAGEVGHMTIAHDGLACPCGQRGCWERYASGSSLGRQGREAAAAGTASRLVELAGGDAAAVRGEHVGTAAAEGDGDALAVLAAYGRWVALGLVNLAALLDPQRFVIGGGLVALGDLLFDPVRASFDRLLAGGRHRPPVDIVPAGLGEEAGAIGAALLAARAVSA